MSVRTFIGKNTKEYAEADFRTTYEGCVLQQYERNGYDDSDFMAIVWDEPTESIKEVTWGTTRGWTYLNSCVVDFTPDVLEKAQKVRYEQMVKANVAAATINARKPMVDRRCRVTRGRKVPQGTEGTVFWVGTDRYASSRWSTVYRAGLRTDANEKFFVPLDYLEVCFPHLYEMSEEDIRQALGSPDRIFNFYRSTPGFVNMVG